MFYIEQHNEPVLQPARCVDYFGAGNFLVMAPTIELAQEFAKSRNIDNPTIRNIATRSDFEKLRSRLKVRFGNWGTCIYCGSRIDCFFNWRGQAVKARC